MHGNLGEVFGDEGGEYVFGLRRERLFAICLIIIYNNAIHHNLVDFVIKYHIPRCV